MTPSQYRQALANGLTQRRIDDQRAEDESFTAVAQRSAPVRPDVWRCQGHSTGPQVQTQCKCCLRRTMTTGATATIRKLPEMVGGVCPIRIQA